MSVVTNYTGSTLNVHPWLSSMVNYATPIKFMGFDIAERKSFNLNTGYNYLFIILYRFVVQIFLRIV